MNKTNTAADRYQIYTGYKNETTLDSRTQVGAAFKEQSLNHYTITLMMFPGMKYYLVKNFNEAGKYTIYSKMIFDQSKPSKIRFLNPVGYGHLDSKLQSYLELKLPLLRCHLFMSLYPDALNQKAA